MTYDPQFQTLAGTQFERWANPQENRQLLVPYGIPILDKNFYGIGVDRGGELVLVIAEEKKRKTTLVINIILNVLLNEKVDPKPWFCIDTLESGMQPDRYTQQMLVNLAGRYLIDVGHVPLSHGYCHACSANQCRELVLTPEYVTYMSVSAQQRKALEYARDTTSSWSEFPVYIYGANIEEGDTRNLSTTVGMGEQKTRWVDLAQQGFMVFVTDHVQQYRFGVEHQTDYEKMIRSMNAMGDFVAGMKRVVFAVSQVSLKSVRESRSGGRMIAAGGAKGHQEATRIIRTDYEDSAGFLGISIEGSRTSGTGYAEMPIDDNSGAMFTPR